MTTDLAEAGLERLICEALTGDPGDPASGGTVGEPSPGYGGGGWSPGNRHDYDREYCVDLCQLRTFLHATQPESAAALCLGEDREELDPKTLGETLQMAQEEVEAVGSGAQVREVVADKGYDSNETVLELKELGLRGYLSERDRGRRNWKGKNRKYQAPVYANRRRIRERRGRRLQRQRSELVERPFAHQFTTGGLRRIFVQGHANVRKRLLIHVCGLHLGLLMRHLKGVVGTPRSLQGRVLARLFTLFGPKTGR